MYAVPGEKENETGLLSYGNGDEEKRTHSLAEGRPEHYYNSQQFSVIPYHFQYFAIILLSFLNIPLYHFLYIINAPTSLTQGGFSFTPVPSLPRTKKSAQGNNFQPGAERGARSERIKIISPSITITIVTDVPNFVK